MEHNSPAEALGGPKERGKIASCFHGLKFMLRTTVYHYVMYHYVICVWVCLVKGKRQGMALLTCFLFMSHTTYK